MHAWNDSLPSMVRRDSCVIFLIDVFLFWTIHSIIKIATLSVVYLELFYNSVSPVSTSTNVGLCHICQ